MCGFVGFLDFKRKSGEAILKEMANTIRHRGPDDESYLVTQEAEATLGIGHLRLSIIDLTSLGRQPMLFKHLSIVFNGEIYNYSEIRNELINTYNRNFVSQSDTEVILQSYDEWGIDCLSKFNGMFSFALVDNLKQILILARDRAGVKPFYYYHTPDLLLFASELKAFHPHPQFPKNIDFNALSLYLQYGYIPAPHTIFENTYKVKPGHYVTVNLINNHIKETVYWDVNDYYNKPKILVDEDEAIIEIEKILVSACNYRMVSDVPVGVFLSGGYDSSCVAALLQKDRTESIKTFTIGFDDPEKNEAIHAKNVANFLGTDHTEYYCTEKDAKYIIPQLATIFDEPFGDSSAIPTILVSQLARKDVTVALSADGGDELFAGYSRYSKMHTNLLKLSKIPVALRKPIGNFILNRTPNILLDQVSKIKSPRVVEAFAEILSNGVSGPNINKYSTQRISNSKLSNLLLKKSNVLHTYFDEGLSINNINDEISKILAIDYKTYLVDDILVKVDRATMSASLEGREPLIDYRLIEYIAQLPIEFKLGSKGNKYIFKEVLHKYVPREIMDRPKMGFSIPIYSWLRGDLKHYLDYYFSPEIIVKQNIFEEKYLFNLINRFNAGYDEDAELVWFILIFQMWYEEWMK